LRCGDENKRKGRKGKRGVGGLTENKLTEEV